MNHETYFIYSPHGELPVKAVTKTPASGILASQVWIGVLRELYDITHGSPRYLFAPRRIQELALSAYTRHTKPTWKSPTKHIPENHIINIVTGDEMDFLQREGLSGDILELTDAQGSVVATIELVTPLAKSAPATTISYQDIPTPTTTSITLTKQQLDEWAMGTKTRAETFKGVSGMYTVIPDTIDNTCGPLKTALQSVGYR